MDISNTIPLEKKISENRPLFTNRPYPPGPDRPFADPYKTEDLPEPVFLIQKHSKGLKKLLFSRAGLFVILILIQIGIIYLAYWVLADHLKNFATWRSLFIAAMLVHLVNNDMNSSAKLTWMVLIMIVPIPASLLLFYQNKSIGTRTIKKALAQNIKESRKLLRQDPMTYVHEDIGLSGTDDLLTYINRSGNYAIFGNTEVTYYPLGEYKYEAMLEELKKAKKFIYMEYFIIEEGEMWSHILAILAEKAKEGVDVRVMYDGMCEISTLTTDYDVRMGEIGIKCKAFSPIRPFISTHYNYRDHRKILVIDGQVAFNGGVNLADEYINRVERFGHWKDTAIKLRGSAVTCFTLMFLTMWNATEKTPDWEAVSVPATPVDAPGFVIPYGDNPLDGYKVGESMYIDILYRARSYVHIMTPYLIMDGEIETALCYAAERGIDVRIILPGIPDKKGAYSLAKTHYKTLLQSGVKIYEYTPGFVHAKVFVSDDEKAIVGTINLDYRSLYHHFECATYMYKTSVTPQIEKDFQDTLTMCNEVTLESLGSERVTYKVMGAAMKLVAPLM